MMLSLIPVLLLLAIGQASTPAEPVPAARPDRDAADFFEARVRPVLARSCFPCHGPEKHKGGLRLDSAASLLKGGDTGPVVVPGSPDDSPLIAAIRYDDIVQMPPDGKLSDQAIADLTEWVRRGASWPDAPAPAPTEPRPSTSAAAGAAHWAFQPVRMPAPPEVRDPRWAVSPIDRFILDRLDREGLRPSPPADRRTLIRRAAYDLTGLPPTPEEVERFINDPAPDAYERLIDRLLASPRYGERWGRHWLDLARYADTKGYVYDDREESRFPFSYVYRDYVIRAFNEDRPYDRFLREQIAADQWLEEGGDRDALAALGFLTLGRRFLGNQHDIIDDRLDVLFRGTQALSVSCARCHDHKYDPIPTEDYYSLYGVFASTTERTVRLGGDPRSTGADPAYEEGLKQRQQALETALETKRAELSERVRSSIGAYLEAVLDAERLPGEEHYVILGEDELNPLIAHRWKAYLQHRARDDSDPIFGPWHAFAAIPSAMFASRASEVARRIASGGGLDHRLNPGVARLFAGPPPASMAEVAARYGTLLAEVHREWQETLRAAREAGASPPTALPDPDREALRQVLYAADSPATIPPIAVHQIEAYFPEKVRVELGKLAMEIDRWQLRSPQAAPHALILEDVPNPRDARVFLRGNPKTKGDEAPRRFLRVLSGQDRPPFRRGSGRRELAECIASADNPLTARVMVNRIWMHHFGEGLVRTPSDFGTRGEPPTHPELLDWLAATFIRDGWSIKAMHRRIMLSNVYRQSVGDQPEGRLRDPENRLLWRMNRRRLDWEALRDALLATAGQLDPALGGRPVPLMMPPYSTRRTVYGYIDRRDLPGAFRVFNLASPDQHTPRRHETTIPQQALFLMNHPFVVRQARLLALLPEVAHAATTDDRIAALYRIVLQRAPTPVERDVATRFLSAPQPGSPAIDPPPWQYGSGVYDAATGRLFNFEPLGVWTGAAWQAGASWPEPQAGLPRLSAEGGQPGRRAAVRRWVAPAAGVVSIGGKVRHPAKEGDGVVAAILSSREGRLGQWEVHAGEAEARLYGVAVVAGDTIDFLVASRDNPEADAFSWAPEIQLFEGITPRAPAAWDARGDFAGPPPRPLSPLEELAQALLLSNEFTFVD
jgi:hypothetical protein